MKKMLCIFLSIIIALSFCCPAFAEGGPNMDRGAASVSA